MNRKILLLSIFFLGYGTINAQTQFWVDNFEDPGTPSSGTRSATVDGGGNASYFKRTDGATSTWFNSYGNYTNIEGSKYWGGKDYDGALGQPVLTPLQVEWTGINIAGKTGLSFTGAFACQNQTDAWENATLGSTHSDFMLVEYRIDAGAYLKLVAFYGNNLTPVSGKRLALDADFNGIGEGTLLLKAFQDFSKNITGTGTTLSIRITSFSNDPAEELAFDNFRLTEVLPVYVSLSSFEARKENGTTGLYWTTAKEVDNVGFDIQRSNDGKVYQTMATVKTQAKDGNSNLTLSYNYIDRTPFNGMNFYRLAETDKQGHVTYSDVRTVNFDSKSNFNCYPNPVQSQLTIEYNAVKEETVNVRITDVLGKVVMTQAVNLQKGFNKAQIDMSGLKQGIYNMTIISNSGVVSTSRVTKN